ncbi:MAG: DUF2141 domain-containing protein [Alphaproteobacteria bacterium]
MAHFFKLKLFSSTGAAFILLLGALMAFASTASADHETGELELYPGDEADVCDYAALQIRVTVNGVTHVGIMKLELYDGPDHFPKKEGRIRVIRIPAMDGPQTICMNIRKPGTYAVTGYHDIDGDRKLDKKWNFTPKEPLGISNNVEVKSRRIPDFEEAAFEVGTAGKNIDLNLVDVRARKKQNERDEDMDKNED